MRWRPGAASPGRGVSLAKALFSAAVLLVFAAPAARADVYFEQEVRDASDAVRFTRRVTVAGPILAMQVVKDGVLAAEYGFDFKKGVYYEAFPGGKHTLFSLDSLAEGFRKITDESATASAGRGERGGMAEMLSRAVEEGKADYRVGVRRSLLARKDVGGLPARLYLLSAGPGALPLNPFGWYWRARVWTTRDVPGYAEYAAAAAQLRRTAGFYKIKTNRVSDFVLAAARVDGFPLEAKFTAKRRSGLGYQKEVTREKTTVVNDRPVKRGDLLYFSESSSFKWHVVFSEGTDFGPDARLGHRGRTDARALTGWLAVPVAYAAAAWAWFLSGIASAPWTSSRRFAVQRIHGLLSAVFLLQVAHFTTDLPYAVSPLFELGLAFLAGSAWIAWDMARHRRRVRAQMREESLRHCPHCGAVIERFYVQCPRCNRPVPPS